MSTADLIAEARRAADKKRADLALESASLFTRLADALEVVDRALTVDWATNISEDAFELVAPDGQMGQAF